ncbi:prepilin peptidase [Chloroflexota bacterium]
MESIPYIIFILLGISIGSFLNVCIDRLPARKSLISPPSHCDSCQHPLSPGDLIPILSYLWLRGRCRYCGARIPIRSVVVEVLTAFLFALVLWRYDLSAEFGVTVFVLIKCLLSMETPVEKYFNLFYLNLL